MRPSIILATICAALVSAIPTDSVDASGASDPAAPPPKNLSAPYVVSNRIFPVKDDKKIARVGDLLTKYVADVNANEPDVSAYELDYIPVAKDFITYEVYGNYSVWEAHLKTPYLATLISTFVREQVIRKHNQVSVLESVTIFLRESLGPI